MSSELENDQASLEVFKTLFFDESNPQDLTRSQEIRKRLQIESNHSIIGSFPLEVWTKIIGFSVDQTNNWQEFGSIALTCKSFWQIQDKNYLTAFIKRSPSGLDISLILKISYKRLKNKEALVCELGGAAGVDPTRVKEALSNMQDIKNIELHSNYMDDNFAGMLSTNMRQLTSLKIVNGEMTDRGLFFLAFGLRNLEHLSLKNCGLMIDTSIQYLAEYLPKLVSLELENCSQLSTDALEEICNNCKDLEVLSVVGQSTR